MASSSCTYTQTFNVTPLIGGFTSLGTTPSTSVFKVVPYTKDLTITLQDGMVVVTSNGVTTPFHRAVIVFRDEFKPSSGVLGCRQNVQYVESTPIVTIGSDRVLLSIGTLLIAVKDDLMLGNVKLPSYSDKTQIAQFLHSYISSHFKTATQQCLHPFSILVLPKYDQDIYQDPNGPVYEKIRLGLVDKPCPDFQFNSWYIALTNTNNPTKNPPLIASSGATEPYGGYYSVYFNVGTPTWYNVGYTYTDTSSSQQYTVYTYIPFVTGGSVYDPVYQL